MISQNQNCSWLVLILCLLLTAHNSVTGQIDFPPPQTTPAEIFNECWELFSNKQYDAAENRLAHLLQQRPLFIDEQRGSPWYLLSEVLIKKKRQQAALDTLKHGLEKLKSHDLFDIFLAEAFVKLAIQLQKAEYAEQITETFYQILETPHPRDDLILTRIYEQCKFLLPPTEQKKIEDLIQHPNASSPSAGQMLRQFWRAKDTTPVTMVNERLIEHLERVEHALKLYPASLPRL